MLPSPPPSCAYVYVYENFASGGDKSAVEQAGVQLGVPPARGALPDKQRPQNGQRGKLRI